MIRNRDHCGTTPVILMSGAVPLQAAVEKLDVQDFLAKPFDDVRLVAAVKRVLAKSLPAVS